MALEQSKLLDWRGKTAVIFASGPSLSTAQIEAVRNQPDLPLGVIAVNSTFKVVPFADVIYACDFLWWKTYHLEVSGWSRKIRCWTQDRSAAERFSINYVRQSAMPGLGKKTVQVNGNSGTGAINLAYLFGARRILLLGFDMKLGPRGEKHHHSDHPSPLVQGMQFGEWIHKMDLVARDLQAEGVEVVNCTPNSALKCFPFGDLVTELAK